MKPSITFWPQFEKQVAFPLVKSAILGATAMGLAAVVWSDMQSPLKEIVEIGLGTTAVSLFKFYFIGNSSSVAKPIRSGTVFANESKSTTTVPSLRQEENGVFPYDEYPVPLEDLRFYCHEIGIKRTSLSVNVWTKNTRKNEDKEGSRPELKIFTKPTYGRLFEKMKKYGYVIKKDPNNPKSTFLLTRSGVQWAIYTARTDAPLSLKVFSEKLNRNLRENSTAQQIANKEFILSVGEG